MIVTFKGKSCQFDTSVITTGKTRSKLSPFLHSYRFPSIKTPPVQMNSHAAKNNQKELKFLCIQLKRFGDVLMTTPAVRALSQHFPGCQIDFLTQRPANTVYENNPYVNRVHCVRWKLGELFPLLTEIYRNNYDVLVDFSGSSKTAGFSWITRIPRRTGFSYSRNSWCFTDALEALDDMEYTGDRKFSLLRPIGLDPEDPSLDYFVSVDAKEKFKDISRELGIKGGPLFAVSPVSKRENKVWPAGRFAEICDRLVEQYRGQIFFLIGPGEAVFAEKVKSRMRNESLPIDENLSLYEAACLLDRAVCYIGNDNGLMHLSVARKRPTFGIFGKHKAKHWTSPTPLHRTIEYDPGCKENCHYPDCQLECLTGVSVESVWEELESFVRLNV